MSAIPRMSHDSLQIGPPMVAPAAVRERAFDSAILLIVGALMTLGVSIVYSASVTLQSGQLDLRHWYNTPLRQCVFAVGGFVTMLFFAQLDYRLFAWERRGEWVSSVGLLAFSAVLLALVLAVGEETLGAARSLTVLRSPIKLSFQPSELAKVAMIIWLAAFLTRPDSANASLLRGYLPSLISAGIIIGLTGIEDFGTAALMGAVMFSMLLLGGSRWTHLAGTALLGAAAGALLIWMKPYRWERIVTFLSKTPDASNEGYQVMQSMIAIASGGWWGRGLGGGIQKYGYLPQDNNDFVFAIVCEELGVVGGIAVICVFLVLLWRGWAIARHATEPFGRMLACGLTLMLVYQAAFNVGVVTNSVPTKGISLPFVSAGGSGVLFLGMAAGMLASVGRGLVNRKLHARG